MSQYFSKFPIIQYNEVFVRDITRRNKFVEENLGDPKLFLPYTATEGQRPEDIADLYYGTVDATWLVLLANNIIDPYYGWTMDDAQFNKYLINKYQDVSGQTGYKVLDWTRNETIEDNIVYYYREIDKDNPELPTSFVPESVVDYVLNNLPADFTEQVITINGIEYFVQQESV